MESEKEKSDYYSNMGKNNTNFNYESKEKRESNDEYKEQYSTSDATLNQIMSEVDCKGIGTSIINEQMLIEGVRKHCDINTHNVVDCLNQAKCLSLENKQILIIQNINIFM
ncbi:hypothetical protein HEP_00066300, partial [Hepatocystis sp. ex Piliocolobus tephrosceles]